MPTQGQYQDASVTRALVESILISVAVLVKVIFEPAVIDFTASGAVAELTSVDPAPAFANVI